MVSKLDQSLSSLIEQSKGQSRESKKHQRAARSAQRSADAQMQQRHKQQQGARYQRQKQNRQQQTPQQFPTQPQVIPVPIPFPTPSPPQPAAPQQSQQPQQRIVGDTVFISGLAKDVNQQDLKDIFRSVGEIKSAVVNFDSKGVSTGTATVVFSSTKAAEKAVKDFDQAQVDGKTMSLRLIGQVITKPVVVKKDQIQQQTAATAQLSPFLSQSMLTNPAFNPFLNNNPFNTSTVSTFSPGKQTQASQQRNRASSRASVKEQTKSNNSRKSRKVNAAAKKTSRQQKKTPVDQTALDREMDNYHSKTIVDPVKAGQPKL